jgi:hypothetical protein
MDMQYRRDYVAMIGQRYMLSPGDTAAMLDEQERDFSSSMSLLLFLYGGNNRPIPLGDVTSQWKVLLVDDDGQTLIPDKIERLRPENPTYLYLGLYFYGLDRWSQAFKVSFPKLDKVTIGQPIGKKPVTLIITGLAGTARMVWPDAGIYYRKPAAAANGPSSAPAAPTTAPPPGATALPEGASSTPIAPKS